MTSNYFKPLKNLTFATVNLERDNFAALIAKEQGSQIHCDLMDVQLCDSAGLAFLMDARRMCHQKNLKLLIANAPVDMLALAKLYGIDNLLKNNESHS